MLGPPAADYWEISFHRGGFWFIFLGDALRGRCSSVRMKLLLHSLPPPLPLVIWKTTARAEQLLTHYKWQVIPSILIVVWICCCDQRALCCHHRCPMFSPKSSHSPVCETLYTDGVFDHCWCCKECVLDKKRFLYITYLYPVLTSIKLQNCLVSKNQFGKMHSELLFNTGIIKSLLWFLPL